MKNLHKKLITKRGQKSTIKLRAANDTKVKTVLQLKENMP